MGRIYKIFIGGLCMLALPATVRAEASRDQAVLDAIMRVEARYLDEDRRDPNFQAGHAEASVTLRKAKYLDKLLNLQTLSKETVLDAYKKAEEKLKASGERKSANEGDKARFEAFKDLVKELRLRPTREKSVTPAQGTSLDLGPVLQQKI